MPIQTPNYSTLLNRETKLISNQRPFSQKYNDIYTFLKIRNVRAIQTQKPKRLKVIEQTYILQKCSCDVSNKRSINPNLNKCSTIRQLKFYQPL